MEWARHHMSHKDLILGSLIFQRRGAEARSFRVHCSWRYRVSSRKQWKRYAGFRCTEDAETCGLWSEGRSIWIKSSLNEISANSEEHEAWRPAPFVRLCSLTDRSAAMPLWSLILQSLCAFASLRWKKKDWLRWKKKKDWLRWKKKK